MKSESGFRNLVISVVAGFFRGAAKGFERASEELEIQIVDERGSRPREDVQVWSLIRQHETWDRERIRAWRRRQSLHVAAGTTTRRDGDSFIAQLAEGPSTTPPGGDAA